MVTLRVGLGLMRTGAASAGGDAVADGDFLRADEDVFDEQPQHSLALLDSGGGGAAAQLGEEAFQVVGELKVGVAVSCLGVERVDLGVQARLACAQVRHPGTQFVDVRSCSENASIMAVMELAALAASSSRRCCCLVTGSQVRAASSRLLISARIRAGSASRCVMWSQTTVSR